MANYGLIPDGYNEPTEILASSQYEKKGAMLASGQSAAYAKGTVMAVITATGLWVEYDGTPESPATGSEIARGILDDAYDATGSVDVEASVYIHGSFIEANLVGLDAGAKTDLGGRTVKDVFTF